MPNIQIYTKSYCPYCALAKRTLQQQGLSFQEIDVTQNQTKEVEMRARSQRTSVPQIFFGDLHIGGNDDLNSAVSSGRLDEVINPYSLALN